MGREAIRTYGGMRGFKWVNLREKPLGRPRHRREGSMKMDLHEVRWRNGLD
jgi:hypothetical protein